MSSSPESGNPYEILPEDGSIPASDDGYTFDGTVTLRDLRAVAPRGPILIATTILGLLWIQQCVSAYSHWSWLREQSSAIREAFTFTEFVEFLWHEIGLFGVLTLGCVFFAWRNWKWPGRMVRAVPTTLGPIRGRLTPDYLEFQTSVARVRTSAEFLMVTQIKRTHLLFSVGQSRLVPLRLFDNPRPASRLAAQIRKSATPIHDGDDRLTSPLPTEKREPVPPDAIPFDGPIYASDVTGTEFQEKLLNSRRYMFLAPAVIVLALGLVCYTLPATRIVTIPVIVLFLLMYYRNIRQSRAIIRTFTEQAGTEAKPSFYPCGWVSESHIVSATVVGLGEYHWAAFSGATHRENSQTILLTIAGEPTMYILLNRRQFRTEDDWNRTQHLIAANVQTTGDETGREA